MKKQKISHSQQDGLGKVQTQTLMAQNEPGWGENFHYYALFEQTKDCVLIVSFDLRYIAVNQS
jgi:hypothetical protein